ncbi:MAG: VOC family protein [Defluviitaleaceae bacterium]|nr:VOC family protein [Defluviitaleaceae bacterium]
MMKKSYPFFMFTNCKAENAINLYLSIFKDAKLETLERWPQGNPAAPAGTVQNALLTLKNVTYRFMDSQGHDHSLTPSTSIFVVCDDEAELRKAYEEFMKSGGQELVPLGEYPFSRLFVWLQDEYGLTWQLSLE